VFIALGLSLDAFAVAVAAGATLGKHRIPKVLRLAFFFGLFQGLMPVLGWLAATCLRQRVPGVEELDHWVAFGLLSFVGGKMIYESRELKSPECEKLSVQLLLAVATSIDALIVGVSFAFLKVEIPLPALLSGLITLAMSLLGARLGQKFGHLFESKAEFIGGLALIGIGLKILLEHLLAGYSAVT
jgi:putative Mn2+ efflux pump MntP